MLTAKICLVTGATSGIGAATALEFAARGADVILVGRNAARGEALVERIEAGGRRAMFIEADLADRTAPDRIVERSIRQFGAIDVLVNNAGGQFPQAALEFSPKGWNAVIDTNLNGTWWMMQSTARHWVAHRQPGAIVNIVADIWRGMPGIAHTCAARAGVIYLSKSVAVEWAPHDIRVNCVAPGCCESTGFSRYPEDGAATFQDSNPMRHAGDEWDVAEGVVYMAAYSGKFVTGEVLNIDGGQQLWGDPWPTGRPDYFRIA